MTGPTRLAAPCAAFQGYVDERSTHHVRGWVRDLNDPTHRVEYEVLLDGVVLARARAASFSPVLETLGIGDATYGFVETFDPPLDGAQRDRLTVRPVLGQSVLELAPALVTAPPVPRIIGYIDQRSCHHVAGWLMDVDVPARRLLYRVVMTTEAGDREIASGTADAFNPSLAALAVGEAAYSFDVLFPEPLSEAERDRISVRPVETDALLPLSPALVTEFEPIGHVAMDIVNNCNLRCPFCVFDYSATRRTELMSARTFEAAMRLLPFTSNGNFWLSCLHEAALHPDLLSLIARVPRHHRRKLMFTTNLAKRMPASYFETLAESGLHHVNISIESLDPGVYERMRQGARHGIFVENWTRLVSAFGAAANPPDIRYITMAYRSNLRTIPAMVKTLFADHRASHVELRDTMAVPHIPEGFLAAELLGFDDWAWLRKQFEGYSAHQVSLVAPSEPGHATADPVEPDSAAPHGIAVEATAASRPETPAASANASGPHTDGTPRPLKIRLEWDGRLIVYGERPGPNRLPVHTHYVVTNIHDIADVAEFIKRA